MVIKAVGAPGHGSKLYDNSAMENLLKSIESIRRYRASQFDLIKAGLKAEGDVVSINMAFLKAGTPSPTVSQSCFVSCKPLSYSCVRLCHNSLYIKDKCNRYCFTLQLGWLL